MAEAWEIDGLCGEAAAIAHRLLCDLLMAGRRHRPGAEAERAVHLARAVERWPTLTWTMAALAVAAPVSAGDGQADDEDLQRAVETIQARPGYRPSGVEVYVVGEAGAFAGAIMDDLRQAEATGDRARKRAFLTRAFAAWPKLARRMARVVQGHAEAQDMAAANPVRGAERLENIAAVR